MLAPDDELALERAVGLATKRMRLSADREQALMQVAWRVFQDSMPHAAPHHGDMPPELQEYARRALRGPLGSRSGAHDPARVPAAKVAILIGWLRRYFEVKVRPPGEPDVRAVPAWCVAGQSPDIFLSFPGPLYPIARSVRHELTRSKPDWKVFVDRDCVPLDVNWPDRIADALVKSRIVVVLLALASKDSWYQPCEQILAVEEHRRHGAPRLVKVDAGGGRDLPPGVRVHLAAYNWVDLGVAPYTPLLTVLEEALR